MTNVPIGSTGAREHYLELLQGSVAGLKDTRERYRAYAEALVEYSNYTQSVDVYGGTMLVSTFENVAALPLPSGTEAEGERRLKGYLLGLKTTSNPAVSMHLSKRIRVAEQRCKQQVHATEAGVRYVWRLGRDVAAGRIDLWRALDRSVDLDAANVRRHWEYLVERYDLVNDGSEIETELLKRLVGEAPPFSFGLYGSWIQAWASHTRELETVDLGSPVDSLGSVGSSYRAWRRDVSELAYQHFRLAVSVARHWRGRGEDFDALLNVANLGLVRAARNFDGQRGYRFSTYAWHWIVAGLASLLNINNKRLAQELHAQAPTSPSQGEGDRG